MIALFNNYSILPCIFILSAISYLKTEMIFFHVAVKSFAFRAPHFRGETNIHPQSSLQALDTLIFFSLYFGLVDLRAEIVRENFLFSSS